jgi:hypothetical protein
MPYLIDFDAQVRPHIKIDAHFTEEQPIARSSALAVGKGREWR